MTEFHKHFLKDFVVPDDSEEEQLHIVHSSVSLCFKYVLTCNKISRLVRTKKVLAKYLLQDLALLDSDYASRGAFGEMVLPEPKTFEEASAQMKRHEEDVEIGLKLRDIERKSDIEEAQKIQADQHQSTAQNENPTTSEEEKNQSTGKWGRFQHFINSI